MDRTTIAATARSSDCQSCRVRFQKSGDHVAGAADGVLELAEQLVVVGSGTGIIRHGWTDPAYIARPTVGFDALSNQVDPCTARWAVGLRDVPATAIEAAAELLGTAYRLLSTVLQRV